MPRPAVAMRSALPPQRLKSITKRLENWFLRNQRELPWRRSYAPYLLWISEVMLQQTRMEVVLPYFSRFTSRFPDVASLAAAQVDDVLSVWSGMGYYRRARMLHEGARTVMHRHGGELPRDEAALRAIPGIGQYTAGAIASIAFDLPRPIVDGNVARILSRIAAIGSPLDTAEFRSDVWRLSRALVERSISPRIFNQGLMEVGALICRPRNPSCEVCPVAQFCSARSHGAVMSFPKPGRREKTESLRVPLYVVSDPSGRILMRREPGRLMTGMFHLPHGSNALFASVARDLFETDRLLGRFRHTVTHRRIRFEVWTARERRDSVGESSGEFAWIDPRELSQLPHPSYVRKALAFLSS